MCVCVLHARLCVHMFLCMLVCMCVEAWGWLRYYSSLDDISVEFLRQGLLLNMELANWVTLSDHWVLEAFLSLPPQCWDYKHRQPHRLLINSGSCVCMAISIWAIILSGLEWPETCFSLSFPVTPALSSFLAMFSSVCSCKHSNWHHMLIFLCMHLIGRFTLLSALLLCLKDNANIQHPSEPVLKSNSFISYFHKDVKGCHGLPSYWCQPMIFLFSLFPTFNSSTYSITFYPFTASLWFKPLSPSWWWKVQASHCFPFLFLHRYCPASSVL